MKHRLVAAAAALTTVGLTLGLWASQAAAWHIGHSPLWHVGH